VDLVAPVLAPEASVFAPLAFGSIVDEHIQAWDLGMLVEPDTLIELQACLLLVN